MPDRDRHLAANDASVGLPIAEAAHIGHGRTRQSGGLRRVDLRFGRRRLGAAAWQQHTNDADPERHSQKEKHDPTHYPDGFPTAFKINLADRLEAVVGDEGTFLGKIDANMPIIFIKMHKIDFY
ncbi:MAG: hypothetical protein WDN48_04890 [Pseudolabrys sp.]